MTRQRPSSSPGPGHMPAVPLLFVQDVPAASGSCAKHEPKKHTPSIHGMSGTLHGRPSSPKPVHSPRSGSTVVAGSSAVLAGAAVVPPPPETATQGPPSSAHSPTVPLLSSAHGEPAARSPGCATHSPRKQTASLQGSSVERHGIPSSPNPVHVATSASPVVTGERSVVVIGGTAVVSVAVVLVVVVLAAVITVVLLTAAAKGAEARAARQRKRARMPRACRRRCRSTACWDRILRSRFSTPL